MISGIYTITNVVNGKMYVGMATHIVKRKNNHKSELRRNIHCSRYLQRSWNKYGEESFKFEILEECDREYLYSQEHWWCNMLNTHNPKYGYNDKPTCPYGIGGHKDETKKKIGIANKGKIITEEQRRAISKTLTGRKGTSHTEEHKIQMREKMTGRKHSPETVEKLKNRVFTEEHRRKISEALKRRNRK